MSAGRNKTKLSLAALLCIALGAAVLAESPAKLVRSGNELYKRGDYKDAIEKYEQVLTEEPAAAQPQFNKANSLYRLGDLSQAIDLYRQIAAESKDIKMVTKARYNLGNCHFTEGAAQANSDVQKAIDEMKTAIDCWRGVLDIEPDNEKAARNIEVARLTIKDLLDRVKNQPEPNQPRDPNSQRQQGQQDRQQTQQQQAGEPNQTDQQQPRQGSEPNQADQQQAQSGQEPNEPQQQQARQQQEQEQQETEVPDATAQQILDREQRQRQQRQIMQRARYQKVEKDW